MGAAHAGQRGAADLSAGPFRFAGQPLTSAHAAPGLGADTGALLDELGIAAGDRLRLQDAGVIATDAQPVEG